MNDKDFISPGQLPEEMRSCTILLKKCVRGHTWLTAENWLETGCLKCALDSAELELRKLYDRL